MNVTLRSACRSGRWAGAIVVACLLVSTPAVAHAQESDWVGYEATPADGFVDTVGVAMHHHYFNASYGKHDLLALLDRLNIRHIRDALTPQSMEFYADFVEQAGPGAGVSYILNDGDEMSMEDQIRMVAERAPGTASQIESDNEPDCDGWQGGEIEGYHDLARDMRALMDSLPELADVPLTTPSFCRTKESHYQAYGDDGVSERFNVHPYVAGLLPEEEIGRTLEWIRAADPDAVPVVTEGGFHNAVRTENDHVPTSEEAESAYLPQMFLEYQRQGIALTHTYELINVRDDPSETEREEHFGLYRYDGSLKPAGASLAALLATMTDPEGAGSASREIRLSTSGGGDELRVQPYTRSDGSVDVVLWMAQKIWDGPSRKDLDNPVSEITVSVPESTEGSFVRIDGTEQPDRQQLGDGSTFTVPVSAHPTILRLGASDEQSEPVGPRTPREPDSAREPDSGEEPEVADEPVTGETAEGGGSSGTGASTRSRSVGGSS